MQRRLYLFCLISAIVALNFFGSAPRSYAQDGGTQTATTADGILALSYPSGWLQTSDTINSVVIADSEASLAAFEDGGDMTGLTLAVTTLQTLVTEIELDFQATTAAEFLAEYQALYDVFLVADTHFMTFDFQAYQQVVYAVDYADTVYLFFAYTDNITQHDAQLVTIIESAEFAPLASPIPTDLVPVDGVVPQAGEYAGLAYASDCSQGSYSATVYLEIGELSLTDGDLQFGSDNPLIFTHTAVGTYTNADQNEVWRIISEDSFIRELSDQGDCATLTQYFTQTDTPSAQEVAEDALFALPLTTHPYKQVTVSDCDASLVNQTNVSVNFALVEDNRLRVQEDSLGNPAVKTVQYYEATHEAGIYQATDDIDRTTIHLVSEYFFTIDTEQAGCTLSSSYLIDGVVDESTNEIAGLDPEALDTTTETGLNTQIFFDGKLTVAYADVFNDSYLPPNDLSFTISADGTNGDLEIYMAASEEIAGNFSGDIASMTLEQFANSDINASVYGTVISDVTPVEDAFHPTVTRAYQQGEDRRLTFYFMDIPDVGKLFVKVTTPLGDWPSWESTVLGVLNSINNPNIVDIATPPSFEVTTGSGIVFTPENSSYDLKINGLGGNPMLEIRHEEGYLITIRFDTGLESGTYDIQGTSPRLVNRTPFGMLNIPTEVTKPGSSEKLSAIYGSNSTGTITLTNDGPTISATFEVTSSFSQFMTFSDQPERPDTLPESVSFSGSFSNIPLASLEE